MPPDLPNEQELTLKKRARRRLVGAIALVLLMIIILPQVLQDRALLAQQEPIKITMPEVKKVVPEAIVSNQAVETPVRQEPVQQDVAVIEPAKPVPADLEVNKAATEAAAVKSTDDTAPQKQVEAKKADDLPAVVPVEKMVAVKAPEITKPEIKASAKSEGSFTVQVGVYSDVANVKRLQEQLKQAGFSTHTEKVKTSKGESLRLRAGNFTSRQDAVAALARIKEIGLPGYVTTNE